MTLATSRFEAALSRHRLAVLDHVEAAGRPTRFRDVATSGLTSLPATMGSVSGPI
jgi:hypothetical protein